MTADGTPKLLDFGIAKVLGSDLLGQQDHTLTVHRVLTPGYASPEQIKDEPMTTASDVYSLGVVLYELLTGSSPYRATTRRPQELAVAVCQLEPEKPSLAVSRKPTEKDARSSGSVGQIAVARDSSLSRPAEATHGRPGQHSPHGVAEGTVAQIRVRAAIWRGSSAAPGLCSGAGPQGHFFLSNLEVYDPAQSRGRWVSRCHLGRPGWTCVCPARSESGARTSRHGGSPADTG